MSTVPPPSPAAPAGTVLLDRPVVAFDLETIPDPAIGRRAMGLEGSDVDVVREMARRRLEETDRRSEYPTALPWHRVVCACVTTLDPATGRIEIRALGGELLDERSHVEGFFRFVTSQATAPRLTSWNGSGFDLPLLRYRGMALGVAAPGFYVDAGERHANNYLGRYHDLHVDLMDVLSGYGASSRVGLAAVAAMLGIPAKAFLERSIIEHVTAGERETLTSYCKLDTVTTMLVFLAWGFHTGRIAAAPLARAIEGLRAAVAAEPDPGWRPVETALRSWPPWLTSTDIA